MVESDALASRRVLVLNSGYEPIRIIGWEKAILLYLAERVEVVEYYEGITIHSPSQAFMLPAVMRLKAHFWKGPTPKATKTRFSRKHIFLRDSYSCQYCGDQYPERELTLDHVIPVSKGGRKSWTNIVTCCIDCNQTKAARTPAEAGLKLLTEPREPRYGFPDLLYYKAGVPDVWKPFLLKTA